MSQYYWTSTDGPGTPYSGNGNHDKEAGIQHIEGLVIIAYSFWAITTDLGANGFVSVLYTDPNGNPVTYNEPTYVLNFFGTGDASSSIANMVAINKQVDTPVTVRLTIVGTTGTTEAHSTIFVP